MKNADAQPNSMSPEFRVLCIRASSRPADELALLTDAQLWELTRREYARYLGMQTVSDADLELLLTMNL